MPALLENSKAIAVLCPDCGAKTICHHEERGCADYLDVYTHTCPDCGHERSLEKFSLYATDRDNGPESCPFCHREVV